ncbi:MAG TPA: acetyl-CoA carboxylase biotin carboxylase subunit [Candidatus Deferrimicrobiaceae bacterium]|nr:acetyl-CoA carboxylase biotin carboxylase subunit [Candidatus Deferrimicrobiaceae bacterium]
MSRSAFRKIFIANRGEIACRAVRPCRELGIRAVTGYSDCDELSLHVKLADEAVRLGPSPASMSYLDIEAVLRAARNTGCDAVFPGYGFLAENPDFAEAVEREGMVFIGPSARVMRILGDKVSARKALSASGVPVAPGLEDVEDAEQVIAFGERVGWPLIIKATAGGGGKGMRKVTSPYEVEEYLRSARSLAEKAFGRDSVYVEKFIEGGRHIEFQFLADRFGNVIHLGERECSIQRQHQKLVEEAPSSLLTPEVRRKMGEIVVRAMKDVGYETAGTLEFLVDRAGKFYALEVNTRIQVEHTVTEMISGFDILRKMFKISAGEKLSLGQNDVVLRGHALQCRINAEDPKHGFAPSFGRISFLRQISGPFVRTESGIYQGWQVPPFYDSLLAKICAVGKDRNTAIQRMRRALREYEIWGVRTTIPLLKEIMDHPDFVLGEIHTGFIEENIARLTEYEDVEEEIFKVAKFVAEVSGLGRNVHGA